MIDALLTFKDILIKVLSSPIAAMGGFWLLSGQADNMIWRIFVLYAFWRVVPVCDPNCPLCYIPNIVVSYYMWKTRHQYKVSNTALAKKFDEKFAWSELSEKFNAYDSGIFKKKSAKISKAAGTGESSEEMAAPLMNSV